MKTKLTTLILVLFYNFSFGQDHWIVRYNDNVDFYLTTEKDQKKIVGKSRDKALAQTIGGTSFFLARLFTKIKYPEFINFYGTGSDNIYNGKYQHLFISYECDIKIEKDSIFITLHLTNGNKAIQKGARVKEMVPKYDYKDIAGEVINLTEDNLYNQQFLQSKHWKKFKKQYRKVSAKTLDDYEMQMGFYTLNRKFPFSHYDLIIKSNSKSDTNPKQRVYSQLNEVDPATCHLKIDRFNLKKEEMDSLISQIEKKGYKNLIIDLRNNPGGNHESAFPLAEYIIDEPVIAGVFPNKNWYQEFDRVPLSEDYDKFTEFSSGSLEDWWEVSKNGYGAYFKLLPSDKHFKGKVYILTNNRTGSTCEPLVFGLKRHDSVTVVGQTTAGNMLSSHYYKLNDTYTIRIPLNDYITYSGERIDGNGIKPDIIIESEKALDYVLNEIITKGSNVYTK